jgi:hypothetical protein
MNKPGLIGRSGEGGSIIWTMPVPKGSPSLQVIAEQVAAERESMRSHAEGLDTKAGVILGFAGVLVGLGASASDLVNRSWLCQAGLVLTMGSAILAALAFIPQSYPALAPRALRDKYLAKSANDTTLTLLDTEIMMISKTSDLVRRKGKYLKGAVACLAAATAFIVIGTLIAGGQGNAGKPAAPASRPSQTRPSAGPQPHRSTPVPARP